MSCAPHDGIGRLRFQPIERLATRRCCGLDLESLGWEQSRRWWIKSCQLWPRKWGDNLIIFEKITVGFWVVDHIETHPGVYSQWLVKYLRRLQWLVICSTLIIGFLPWLCNLMIPFRWKKKTMTSGKITVCYGKSPWLIGKSSINGPFSIANCEFAGEQPKYMVECIASLHEIGSQILG